MSLSAVICLVTAVDIEFKAAVSGLSNPVVEPADGFRVCRGVAAAGKVTVYQAGMGAVGFPDFLSDRIPRELYSSIVVVGLAGALDDSLKRCSAIVYDSCFDLRGSAASESSNKTSSGRDEFESIPCDPLLSQSLFASLLMDRIPCERGSGATIDRIVTSAAEKLHLGRRSGARAVDMETYEILGVARRHGLPSAAVRVISDEAMQDLPDFNLAVDSQGRMNMGSMLRVLSSTPVVSAKFLSGLRPVSRSLRRSIAAIISRQLVKPL